MMLGWPMNNTGSKAGSPIVVSVRVAGRTRPARGARTGVCHLCRATVWVAPVTIQMFGPFPRLHCLHCVANRKPGTDYIFMELTEDQREEIYQNSGLTDDEITDLKANLERRLRAGTWPKREGL